MKLVKAAGGYKLVKDILDQFDSAIDWPKFKLDLATSIKKHDYILVDVAVDYLNVAIARDNVDEVREIFEKAFRNEFEKENREDWIARIIMALEGLKDIYDIDILAYHNQKVGLFPPPYFKVIYHISRSDLPVLILGETGTSKELMAKAVHQMSDRRTESFVEINCAAIPVNLLESELFGYAKGAFTDASQPKRGLFEYANGGVCFLDEISEMKEGLQSKLLRFLEDGEIRRVGDLKTIKVDVRIISATNKDLKKLIELGKFREDLFYRLNVIPLFVPPLRERKDDILELSKFFINQFNKEFKKNIKGFSPIAQKMILLYDWPGNVRELKNTIERAMIFEDRDQIMVERLPLEIISASSRQSSDRADIKLPESGIDIEEVERELLKQALTMAKGNQSKAARLLNIGVDAMRYRMKKFGFLTKDK